MTWKFIIIAALALAVRLWTAFAETLPLSGDEIAHGNYVGYIYDHHSLPDSAAPNVLVPEGKERLAHLSYEFYQPPGYYIVAALLGGNTPRACRVVSVVMFMAAFLFVWAATRSPGNAGDIPLLCALAFTPGLIITTSTIGNDVFLLMGSAITFYACVKQKTWALIAGALVLATAKFHGFPILLVLSVYYFLKRNNRWGIISLASAAGAGGIIFWRWDLQVENAGLLLLEPTILNIAKTIHETLITGFLHPFYDFVAVDLMALTVVGGVVLTFLAVRRYRRLPDMQKYVILVVCLVWAGWCIFKQFPSGRYLYAAIPWLALVRRDRADSLSAETRKNRPAAR
jgi:hypothetical protein